MNTQDTRGIRTMTDRNTPESIAKRREQLRAAYAARRTAPVINPAPTMPPKASRLVWPRWARLSAGALVLAPALAASAWLWARHPVIAVAGMLVWWAAVVTAPTVKKF